MNHRQVLDSIVRGRRSTRTFLDRPVPRELIEELIESATWAPSAANRQDWTFTVATSTATIADMSAAVAQRWGEIVAANAASGVADEVAQYATTFGAFEEAQAVIAVSCRAPDALQQHLLGTDARTTSGSAASAAMAAQNLMLSAHARGLGSCCMTGALAARHGLASILELGRREELVCLVTLGWPAEQPKAPARKPVAEVTRFLE